MIFSQIYAQDRENPSARALGKSLDEDRQTEALFTFICHGKTLISAI
jgi:hypothetical protein